MSSKKAHNEELDGQITLTKRIKSPVTECTKEGVNIVSHYAIHIDGLVHIPMTWRVIYDIIQDVEANSSYKEWLRKQLLDGA